MPLSVEGTPFKVLEQFTYLGTELASDGITELEITVSIGKVAQFYQSIKHIVWEKRIPNKDMFYTNNYVCFEACNITEME